MRLIFSSVTSVGSIINSLSLNAEGLQRSIHQFYECLNVLFTQETDSQISGITVALFLCVKQVNEFILEYLIG